MMREVNNRVQSTMKMLYTYHEAAEILRFPSYNAIKIAVHRGKIPTVTRGGSRNRFIHRDVIAAMIQQQ